VVQGVAHGSVDIVGGVGKFRREGADEHVAEEAVALAELTVSAAVAITRM
jgi:hypothetical protein